MSSREENSSHESSTMEFVEESKLNVQNFVTTPLTSNIPSNPPASPPQTLIASNSPPLPPPAVPQPLSIITSPPPPHPLPHSTFTSPPPPHPLPHSTFTSPPPAVPQPVSITTSPPPPHQLPPSTFISPPPPPPPRFSNNHDDDHYFNSFPPGYRFCPHDHELVLHYLSKKVKGLPLPRNRIVDVTLYQHDPEFLADRYKNYGEKEWYFFTPRDRKYKNGRRPNRAAGGGYWKATGADKDITYDKAVVGADGKVTVEKVHVGYRKALVYYTGKAPKGDKTNWIMHEFRVKDPPPQVRNDGDDMRLDDWVLCRIYKKHEKRTNVDTNVRNRQRNEENSPGSIDDIGEDYVNRHDHNSNDLAAIEADYAGEIYDMGAGSLENSFPMLDHLSQQQTALIGFSDAIDFYPAPSNYSRMLHDTQVPRLAETYGSPSPMISNIIPDYWPSMQQGYQDADQFLNSTNGSRCNFADQFLDRYSVKPTNLPRNPAPLVNLRPANTVPPIRSLQAPLTRSLPPMNTAHPTGGLPREPPQHYD